MSICCNDSCIDAPHVVQSRTTRLALSALDNLHTLHIGIEHLDRHLDSHTGKLIAEQERGIDAAQIDTQDDTVEWVAVLERYPDNIARFDAARVPSVVEKSFPLTLGIELCQLRLGNLCDGVLAYFAAGGRRGVHLDRLGALYITIAISKISHETFIRNWAAYRCQVGSEQVFVTGTVRGGLEGEGCASGAASRLLK